MHVEPHHASWRERRHERHEAKAAEKARAAAKAQHEAAVTAWNREVVEARLYAQAASRAAQHRDCVAAPPLMRRRSDESVIFTSPAGLVENHRDRGHYVGGYAGTSVHVAKGVNVRVGGVRGHYVQGEESLSVIDSGEMCLTTRRIVFLGEGHTREWLLDHLVAAMPSPVGAVMLHVSNREKVSGVRLGSTDATSRFAAMLTLAQRMAELGADTLSHDLTRELAELEASKPKPPAELTAEDA